MKPGPELDALVREKFFVHEIFSLLNPPQPYSQEIGAAWLVVEELRLQGQLVGVFSQPDGSWIVSSSKALNPNGDGTADGYDDTVNDTTVRVASPAHGICLVSVEFDLPDGVLDEYVVDCTFCGRTRTRGHEKDCPYPRMRPDLQEFFRK